jgi:uncharacterized membrane protein (UPF0182 family)
MELLIAYLVTIVLAISLSLYDDLQYIGELTVRIILITILVAIIPLFNLALIIISGYRIVQRKLVPNYNMISDILDTVVYRRKE